jgi:hypothetical protein
MIGDLVEPGSSSQITSSRYLLPGHISFNGRHSIQGEGTSQHSIRLKSAKESPRSIPSPTSLHDSTDRKKQHFQDSQHHKPDTGPSDSTMGRWAPGLEEEVVSTRKMKIWHHHVYAGG